MNRNNPDIILWMTAGIPDLTHDHRGKCGWGIKGHEEFQDHFNSMRTVTITPGDPGWTGEFDRIAAMISGIIGDLIIGIEHVGSTSVPGLAAKSVIDLDAMIRGKDLLPAVIERLDHAGSDHEGNPGIEGREAFKRRYDDGFMTYHLYVCQKDGKGYIEHIAFRDYLRSHPDAVLGYEQLKSGWLASIPTISMGT